MQASNATSSDKFCIFRSDRDRFCLPATEIRNVAPRPQLCRLPLTDELLAGLAHEQREFFPVYSFSVARGAQATRDCESQMLVMLGESGAWGLLVDEVLGLESLELSLHGRRDSAAGWSSVSIGSTTWGESFITAIDAHYLNGFIQKRVEGFWDAARRRTPREPQRIDAAVESRPLLNPR